MNPDISRLSGGRAIGLDAMENKTDSIYFRLLMFPAEEYKKDDAEGSFLDSSHNTEQKPRTGTQMYFASRFFYCYFQMETALQN